MPGRELQPHEVLQQSRRNGAYLHARLQEIQRMQFPVRREYDLLREGDERIQPVSREAPVVQGQCIRGVLEEVPEILADIFPAKPLEIIILFLNLTGLVEDFLQFLLGPVGEQWEIAVVRQFGGIAAQVAEEGVGEGLEGLDPALRQIN